MIIPDDTNFVPIGDPKASPLAGAFLQRAGWWKSEGSTKHDDMIIVELISMRFVRTWCKRYRRYLEQIFIRMRLSRERKI